jgi:hypothetical protein
MFANFSSAFVASINSDNAPEYVDEDTLVIGEYRLAIDPF